CASRHAHHRPAHHHPLQHGCRDGAHCSHRRGAVRRPDRMAGRSTRRVRPAGMAGAPVARLPRRSAADRAPSARHLRVRKVTRLSDLLPKPTPDTTVLQAANILVYDIETTPARVEFDTYDLKLRNPYIHHSKVTRPGGLLAWSAHWLHEPGVVHYGDVHDTYMHERLWDLLDRSSYRVTFNGDRFDEKRVRGYF